MKLKETFSQDDLHLILPSKIAMMANLISQRTDEDPVRITTEFYKSETYARLSVEETKYWWFGPADLARIYEEERKG